MSVRRSLLVMAFSAALPVAGLPLAGGAIAAPLHAGCVTGGYSTAASKCVTVPSSGKFSIKVPHSHATLIGTGTRGTAGTKVHVVAVANPPRTSGVAIRVTASGPFPPLHASSGKLFSYSARTGKLKTIKSLKKPGIFVLRS